MAVFLNHNRHSDTHLKQGVVAVLLLPILELLGSNLYLLLRRACSRYQSIEQILYRQRISLTG